MKFLSTLLAFALLSASALAQNASRISTNAGVPSNGTSEVQTLTIGGTPTAGSLRLRFDGFTTSAITWSATNATLLSNINTALDALPNLENGEVVATDTSLTDGIGTIALTFGGNRAKLAVNLIVAVSSLTGTSPTAAVTDTTPGVTATGRGEVVKGSLLVNTTTPALYQNTGTTLEPVWEVLPTDTVGIVSTDMDASSELLAIVADETGTGALTFATAPTFTTSINIGAAGVKLSDDGDGAITFLGAGNGTDEDLTLNLDDTANTGTFSSSTGLAMLTFTGIGLTASGNVLTPKATTVSADGAITIASGVVVLTKAGVSANTVAAPSSQDGTRITIMSNSDNAHVVTFTGGTLLDGTATANTTATFAAFKGASVTVIAVGATWLVESFNAVTIAP